MQLTRLWKCIVILFCFLSCFFFDFGIHLAADENAPEFFVSENHMLKMEIPSGWVRLGQGKLEDFYNENRASTPGLLYMATESLNEETPHIMLKFDIFTSGSTLEQYLQVIKGQHNEIKQANPNLKYLKDPEVITFGETKYTDPVTLTISGNSCIKTSLYTENLYIVYYHFLRGKLTYTFIGAGPKEKQDYYSSLFEKAASSIEFEPARVMTENDLTAEELNRYSIVYHQAGQFDRAIELNELALGKNSTADAKAEILYCLSTDYYEMGFQLPLPTSDKNESFQKAIDYGKQCLEVKPDHWKAMVNMARVYIVLDQLEESDHYFTEAEKYNPKLKTFSQPGFISEHGAVLAALRIDQELAAEKATQKGKSEIKADQT